MHPYPHPLAFKYTDSCIEEVVYILALKIVLEAM